MVDVMRGESTVEPCGRTESEQHLKRVKHEKPMIKNLNRKERTEQKAREEVRHQRK
jgi:hypothetical protein